MNINGNINGSELQEKLKRMMWLARLYQRKNHAERGPMADSSRGQGRVLAALKMVPEISTKDLSYLLGIRPQSLNELLSKLENNGFVTRTQSETDKRVIMAAITEKGRSEEQQDSEFSFLFESLSEGERRNFSDYLDRIIASLEEQVGVEADADEFEWMDAARERFGDNFEQLLAMRSGGNPLRRMFHGNEGFPMGGGPGYPDRPERPGRPGRRPGGRPRRGRDFPDRMRGGFHEEKSTPDSDPDTNK